MNYEVNKSLLRQDIDAVKNFFTGFSKSFGPSPYKYGFWGDQHTRFRLYLVELGPVKIIKFAIVMVVALVAYLVLFRRGDNLIRIITAFGVLAFWAWMFLDEFKKDSDESFVSKFFVKVHEAREAIFPEKKEEKKK